MKLTKDLIGKKIRRSCWDKGFYFLPLAATSNNHFLGEDQNGTGIVVDSWEHDWQLYEETKQKKRIEAAPYVYKNNYVNEYLISKTNHLGSNLARLDASRWTNNIEYVTWPASFDKEKGVWFYEYEE